MALARSAASRCQKWLQLEHCTQELADISLVLRRTTSPFLTEQQPWPLIRCERLTLVRVRVTGQRSLQRKCLTLRVRHKCAACRYADISNRSIQRIEHLVRKGHKQLDQLSSMSNFEYTARK